MLLHDQAVSAEPLESSLAKGKDGVKSKELPAEDRGHRNNWGFQSSKGLPWPNNFGFNVMAYVRIRWL